MEQKRINQEETREMQQIILGVLLAIDQVCREHHLRYYLIAGTMLGAVRHGGFIPWDDDADVAMPREDYDRFMAHANEWLPEGYELVCGETDPCYPYLFGRVHDVRTTYILRRSFNFVGGIPVDVFPLDGMTQSPLARRLHYLRFGLWKKVMYFNLRDPYKHGRHSLDSLLVRTLHKVFSHRWLHRKLDGIQKAYDYDRSSLVADHDNKPDRGILPKEVYGTPTEIAFEGHRLMGVARPDDYLSYCYGNYMELPKELPPQNFRYMDMHRPYRDYLREHGGK